MEVLYMSRFYVEFKLAGSVEFDDYYGDYVFADNANQALNMICDWFFGGNPEINQREVQYRVLTDTYEIIDEGWCD